MCKKKWSRPIFRMGHYIVPFPLSLYLWEVWAFYGVLRNFLYPCIVLVLRVMRLGHYIVPFHFRDGFCFNHSAIWRLLTWVYLVVLIFFDKTFRKHEVLRLHPIAVLFHYVRILLWVVWFKGANRINGDLLLMGSMSLERSGFRNRGNYLNNIAFRWIILFRSIPFSARLLFWNTSLVFIQALGCF